MENNEENERASRSDSVADSKEKSDAKEQGNRRRFPRRTRAKSHSENRKKAAPNDKAGEKKHKNTEGERRAKNPARDDLNLMSDLKKGVEINDKIQQSRVATHHSLDKNNTGKVRITPLGGLGEIGANITVIETENSAIVVDVGMSFPEAGMHGVDILVPDFSYLEIIKDKIAGVVITHAHEDHIGAVPYLYKKMQFPLYGTPLPLGMISSKFDEHGLKKFRSLFRVVEKRKPIQIGDFEIEWIHITHSIIDSSALAIRTSAGVILHTGDFKIDHTPIDGFPTDLHRLAHYGEEGVLAMLSDSTNSHKAGYTQSEATVGPTFDNLFAKAAGRVIMSTFSSNIHRVYQAIEHGIKYNRKVAVIGRSMEKNLEISRQLGYINLPQNIFIEAHEVDKYPDNEVLIVTTGSQGETMSALYRMATDEHRHIKIKPTDHVIISAKAIPGNETAISTVINFLMKAGASVAYQDFSEIHVSGHAAQEEQKLLLRLIKPKFFLPVHGEFSHIHKHRETAIKCGVAEKNILLMEDGDQIEITPTTMRKVKSVRTGKSYIDNQVSKEIENDVVLDRQKMANEGVCFLAAEILSKEAKFADKPKFSLLGIIGHKEERSYTKELEDTLTLFLAACKKETLANARALENEIRNLLKKQLFKKTKRYPAIVISLFLR